MPYTPRRPDFLRTTTFRWAVCSVLAFVAAVLLLFGVTYQQAASYLTRQVDRTLLLEARSFVGETPADVQKHIEWLKTSDPRHFNVTGLFDRDGRLLAGNLSTTPPGLAPPGEAVGLSVSRIRSDGSHETRVARVVQEQLPDGMLLVLGRDVEAANELTEIVTQALLLGAVPMAALAIAGGAFLSLRTRKRIEAVNRAARAIMRGHLTERLPLRGTDDDFDQLANIVNRMLAEIERLMLEAKGVGDDIAHDLRTPLTRLRSRLERAHANAVDMAGLKSALGEAINELDQTLVTIDALLRIAEIDDGRRKVGFKQVKIAQIAVEVNELYEPAAEDKRIALTIDVADWRGVEGDRDLLFEAVTNIVDNAVKFAPPGGFVVMSVLPGDIAPILRIDDSGAGIPVAERSNVLRRFYRLDRSRHLPGTGLGLSLVAAIARLHGFGLSIDSADAGGCRVILECWPHEEQSSALARHSPASSPPGPYFASPPLGQQAGEA